MLTFYPIGALVAPFISSSIIGSGLSWRFSYYVIIFIIAVNMALYIFIIGRRKGTSANLKDERLSFKEIFTDRKKNFILVLIFFAIIFYCSSETVISTWAPTFFRLERGLDIQSAGFLITLFWILIVIGRLISLFLAGKVESIRIMAILSMLAIVSISALIFIKTVYIIYILVVIAGLGYSALFPLLVSTGSTIYEKGRGVLATILFVASNIGVSSAPFITRYISAKNMLFSVGIAPVIMAGVFILMIVLMLIWPRKVPGPDAFH